MKEMFFRLLAVLLVLPLLAGCAGEAEVSTSSAPPESSSSEAPVPEEDPSPEKQPQTIEIGTVEELLAAARRINTEGYDTRRDTYLLTADIDLAGVEWTPIGMKSSGGEIVEKYIMASEAERDPNVFGFNGTFDGQGHTIYNLTITEEQSAALLERTERNAPDPDFTGIAFFYSIGPEGVVKDLRLENASVSVPVDGEEDYGHAAILAAECIGWLKNISVQGKVQGVSETGGLVGYLGGMEAYSLDGGYEDNGQAEDCTADVEVSGCDGIGGLVGTLHYGIIADCTVQGTVTAIKAGYGIPEIELPRNIGGLVGHSVQGRAYDSGASVYVLTQVPSRCVGGFGGLWEGGGVTSCWVDGQKAGGWEPVDDYHRLDQERPEVEIR